MAEARIVRTNADVLHLARDIESAGPDARVTYDVETTGLHPYAGDYLTGMSFCITHPSDTDEDLVGYYVPLGHHEGGNITREGRGELARALGITDATHVGFNTPFDWAFLLNEGILMDVPRNAHDVQIKRWLQDENGIKALKKLGEMWLGSDAKAEADALKQLMSAHSRADARAMVRREWPEMRATNKDGSPSKVKLTEEGEALAVELSTKRTWDSLTAEEIGEYAAQDAVLTHQIDVLLDGVSPRETIEREMRVNAICIDMTRKGVSVDEKALRSAAALYAEREQELKDELREVHGLENPNSGPQVAALLYDRLGLPIRGKTRTGAPATDKNALEQLAGDPVAAKVLAARRWNKARTAYCEPFADFASKSPDGRVHGFYGTTRTVTGRLASSGPNVMTIPREESLPEVRSAFNLDPASGTERLGFDLASAELWVMASITKDPVLTSALLEGRNLHIETMQSIFGGEPDKHRREYTLSKNGNYGVAYGAGLDQITIYAAKSGCDPAEARRVAQQFVAGHKRTFAVQHAVADKLAEAAEQLGKLPLVPPGRYRHFRSPGLTVPGYTALNALVQGGVAEFMKDTMIELYARGYGELLILQVHDELVFDVPAGKDMEREILDVLTKISLDINPFRYPLTWDAKSWRMGA